MNQSIYRTMAPLEVSEGGARGYGPISLYFAPPSCQKKGGRLLESYYSVGCSGRIVLECKRCGDSLTLLGLEEDWNLEDTEFECECGANLTLAKRNNDESIAIKRLLREDRRIQAFNLSIARPLSHRR
jgi:hypothetical protein